jgi:hypothetical protein
LTSAGCGGADAATALIKRFQVPESTSISKGTVTHKVTLNKVPSYYHQAGLLKPLVVHLAKLLNLTLVEAQRSHAALGSPAYPGHVEHAGSAE